LIPEFTKFRKVKWLKTVVKRHINPNLYKLFNSHQMMARADEYSKWIDSMLYDFFRKGDEYHIVLDMPKSGISAIVIFGCYSNLLYVVEKYCQKNGISESINDVNVLINLNSPGKVELFGRIAFFILIAGAVIIFLNGGHAKLRIEKLGLDMEISSSGIIKSISDFLDAKSNRSLKKTLEEQIKISGMKEPEDLIRLLEEINRNAQNE
jgi:hypothetical protein